ncbi:MAG: FAD-dependent oxidoreductase [Oscillospiraceae bacterium]|nr:FAD-dependent oxidoreductase [Oscillospiraceae bacterium]
MTGAGHGAGSDAGAPARYVIIGNSAAAIGAAEGIRQTDKSGEIILISDERHHTYSRPLISYLLLGKVTEEGMRYRSGSFYEDSGCKFLHGSAVSVDAKGKAVLLSDGSRIPYDKLLAATGSSAFIPPFEGLDTVREKTTFMSLDDAKRLEGMLGPDKRVLIAGAGLIGLKCAEGISERVKSVTVFDLAPRILSSVLDEGGAQLIRERFESKGIGFRLSASVRRFDKDTAVFEDGSAVPFDVLVLAVGVRPNTALLDGIAEIGRGIVINARSETSAPDIYAAGDCTQALDVSSGQERVMALLPNAYMQGECAGINMAGGDKSFDRSIPMNAVGFFGLHVVTAGHYDGDTYEEDGEGRYKRLFYSGDRLNGMILIGNVEKAGIYTSLIRERTPLSSIDFALVCEKPGLMAFTKEERFIKLGGGAG